MSEAEEELEVRLENIFRSLTSLVYEIDSLKLKIRDLEYKIQKIEEKCMYEFFKKTPKEE